ncbi:MAG TPA: nitrilase-related carbon-nitrogen hydrolase [Acidobacteriaceae bacterium]|jgi:apolipoprotein N-acyltransferase|nr:nitrilase-related carbon-nitrogen hydrolase [Acidobacteriaceae bacterium]
MAFAVNPRPIRRSILFAGLAIVSSAALIWFGNGLDPWWPLFWFAPLPILLFATRSSMGASAAVAFFSILLGSGSMVQYFALLGPAWVWLIVYSIFSLVFTSAVLSFRGFLRRGSPWRALLAFPTIWVTGEYAANLFTPHGTAGSLAYTQLKFLPFLQLASITGPWGMSFLLLLFPAAIAIAVHLRSTAPRQAFRIVSVSLGTLALVLIFGLIRLAQPAPAQQVTVGLIASDAPGNLRQAKDGAATTRLLSDYAAQAQSLVSRGAQVIVIPEKVGKVLDPDSAPADSILQSLADKTGATVVAGFDHQLAASRYNEARIYQPQTSVVLYHKHHLLPPFEDIFNRGTDITLLQKPSQSWGVAICKDMDFTGLSRQYGNAGIGLLLDPGWDFNMDRSWHGHIAIMRGVESGFSIAHTAKNGYLTVTDDRGRILAETRSDSAPFATLLARVPAAHDKTVFLRIGDWFPWMSIATLVLIYLPLRKR